MYGWIWRVTPGPTWLRVTLVGLLGVAAVLVLFQVVFPALAPHLPFNDGTVDSPGT
ncbi:MULTISPECIES: hypothetical protein [unclassified Ornithinimicrobium]|uniref:hypothetical protein n=1 Tax=unclassified Ornithinimicrobium TaxID=2615080 RepID=UPI0038541041